MVEPVARAEERMISNDLFRLSLAEAAKRMKRSEVFRHPLFACGELNDPVDMECPFIMQAPLPEIEREWCFSRASVPPWIKLFVGRAAREMSISRLEAEYNTLEFFDIIGFQMAQRAPDDETKRETIELQVVPYTFGHGPGRPRLSARTGRRP
jgi:hypothetical protein